MDRLNVRDDVVAVNGREREAGQPDVVVPSVGMAKAILAERWKIAIVTATFAVLSAIAGVLITPEYDASVVVLPLAEGTSGGLGGIGSSLGGALGGLGALVGLSQFNDAFKAEAVATLKSNRIAAQYIEQNHLLPIIFKEKWNPYTRSWRTTDPKKVPTLWKAVRMFAKKIRNVESDRQTGVVTLTIRWSDPTLAAQWANGLVADTNEYLRARAIAVAKQHIAFLEAQILKTKELDLQRDLYSLEKSELEREMIARGRAEYALRVIDPAMVPEKPVTPSLPVIIVAGTLLGALLSIIWVVRRRQRVSMARVPSQ